MHDMLKKSGTFTFTADHVKLVREMMDILSSPKVLAFPCYEGAISRERPFRLVADASVAGLGAVIEQAQKYGSVRPIWFLSRTTYSNETRWNATELEMGAIVWTVKKNRTLFYGIPFQNFSDHQPSRNFGSLAEKTNRVQRWYDFLSAYTFELKYKPGRENLVADMLSRLPLPATKADEAPDVRLTDPSDLDVYMIGASGVQPSRLGPVFSGQEARSESTHREIFVVEENGCRAVPLTTSEAAGLTLRQIQGHAEKRVSNTSGRMCVPDDSKLVDPGDVVLSGQTEPGVIMYAVPVTEVGRRLLEVGQKSNVHAITQGEGSGSGSGGTGSNERVGGSGGNGGGASGSVGNSGGRGRGAGVRTNVSGGRGRGAGVHTNVSGSRGRGAGGRTNVSGGRGRGVGGSAAGSGGQVLE